MNQKRHRGERVIWVYSLNLGFLVSGFALGVLTWVSCYEEFVSRFSYVSVGILDGNNNEGNIETLNRGNTRAFIQPFFTFPLNCTTERVLELRNNLKS